MVLNMDGPPGSEAEAFAPRSWLDVSLISSSKSKWRADAVDLAASGHAPRVPERAPD
jgi:hypothetical protein